MPSACVKAVDGAWKGLWKESKLCPLPTALRKYLTSQVFFAHISGTIFSRLRTINSQPKVIAYYLLDSRFSLFSTVSITNTNLINKGFVL